MSFENNNAPGISDHAVSKVKPPNGWIIVDLLQKPGPVIDTPDEDKLTAIIDANLPYVAKRVEMLVLSLDHNLNFSVHETYIAIDADAAFHIILLFSREDYFSPKIQRAKILAEEYLGGTDSVGVRFTFTISDDYLKYHSSTNSHKLKYVNPAHTASNFPKHI